MLGHMPALLLANPRSVLVEASARASPPAPLCCTRSQENRHLRMERIIPPVATRFFGKENNNVSQRPARRNVYDDARHFVLTTREKVRCDHLRPDSSVGQRQRQHFIRKEYFELVKQHLNPGRIVTQWVPLYESDLSTVKSELATFFDVFPGGTVMGQRQPRGGYDTVLLGQGEPTKIDVDQLQAKLERPD